MWKLPNKNHQNKKVPLYRQLVFLIEEIIENGHLEDGRLPSERELCNLLNLSRTTVVQALNDLEDRGIITRKQGSGTFVNRGKWGLQHYPTLKWETPSSPKATREAKIVKKLISHYQAGGIANSKNPLDLSKSHLPASLLTKNLMPETSWHKVLQQEMDRDASFTGFKPLKESVQEHLEKYLSLKVGLDEILITSGVQQALFLISQCLLQAGDAIGIEAPSYFYSLPVFQAAGLRLFAIEVDEEGIRPEALEDLSARFDLKMIFLNPIFQNPTGLVMSPNRKKEIFDLCSFRHIPIVEDDSYSGLSFDPELDLNPIKALDRHGRILYIGSLSSYVGSNIRAGWLVAPKAVALQMAEVRSQMDAGLSILPQLLARHYLDQLFESHTKNLRKELKKRSEGLLNWIKNNFPEEFNYQLPQGGFHLYLYPKKDEGLKYFESFLKKGIIPARGVDFGDSGNKLRLNFANFYPE